MELIFVIIVAVVFVLWLKKRKKPKLDNKAIVPAMMKVPAIKEEIVEKRNVFSTSDQQQPIVTSESHSRDGLFFVPFLEQMVEERNIQSKRSPDLFIEVNGEDLTISRSGFNRAYTIASKDIKAAVNKAKRHIKAASAIEVDSDKKSLLGDQINEMIEVIKPMSSEVAMFFDSLNDGSDAGLAYDKVGDLDAEIADTIEELNAVFDDWAHDELEFSIEQLELIRPDEAFPQFKIEYTYPKKKADSWEIFVITEDPYKSDLFVGGGQRIYCWNFTKRKRMFLEPDRIGASINTITNVEDRSWLVRDKK